jgi:hypothetical protein
MVLALMAIALPVMASDVTLSGELTAGFNTDFSTYTPNASNAYIDLAAKVDKNNTVNAEISAAYPGATATTLDMFYLVSDLGGAFNLSGIDPVLTVGYGDPVTAATLGVSGYGNEEVAFHDSGAATEIALQTAVGKTANVLVAFDPMVLADQTAVHLLLNGDASFGPITAAVYYGVNGAALSDSNIGAGVKYTTSMSGIDVGAAANVNYALGTSPLLAYGVGLSAGMKMFSAGLGFNGDNAATPNMHLTVNASLTPSDMYGVDLGVGSNLTTGGQAFDTLDASGWVAAGATKIRLGYLYEPAGGGVIGDLNAPSNVPGMYASFDLSF